MHAAHGLRRSFEREARLLVLTGLASAQRNVRAVLGEREQLGGLGWIVANLVQRGVRVPEREPVDARLRVRDARAQSLRVALDPLEHGGRLAHNRDGLFEHRRLFLEETHGPLADLHDACVPGS